MSTVILSDSCRPPYKAQLNKALWVRFVWKEYRMLRGFWLAILVLGVVEQWISTLMMVDAYLIPSWLFTSAWGAAALYAVGAAVTLFGAENEERTRGYLQLLPGRWQPMFFAKVAVAVGSAVLLAGVLCLTGWMIAGLVWPTGEHCILSLSVAGVAIVEATVWGLLFSLLWKQPLMAAVAAMAVASFGSQLAVLATPLARDSFTAESYQAAVPMRLAICLVVFAVDVLIGSQWLTPLGLVGKRRREVSGEVPLFAAKPQSAVKAEFQPWRRRMFVRLIWQTWRESWKTILAAIVLGLFLTIVSLGVLETLAKIRLPLTSLVLPALLGALVFWADQRRDHRLFLATHSARPRYVWLARQVVWLGMLALLAGGVNSWISQLALGSLTEDITHYLRKGWSYAFFRWADQEAYESDWLLAWNLQRSAEQVHQAMVLGWCAIFVAYAIGQVCSLAFKREVLAGFLAILLSIVLAAWSLVVFAWQLNALWFVLPIGLGAMFATWLRIPNWLIGRNHLRSWLAPALAVSVPLLVVTLGLPAARLAQMDLPQPTFPFLKEPLKISVRDFKQAQIARNETANLIRQIELKQTRLPTLENLTVDGKSWEEFEIEVPYEEFGSIDSLSSEDRKTALKFEQEGNRVFLDANGDAVRKIIEVLENSESGVPAYGFEDHGFLFTRSTLTPTTPSTLIHSAITHRPQSFLLSLDAKQHLADGELDKAWRSIRASIKINPQNQSDYQIDDHLILDWAQQPQQSSERIKSAIVDLEELFAKLSSPRDMVLHKYLKILEVILDKELPQFANSRNINAMSYLPYLANKLPWERKRALQALEYLTTQTLNYIDAGMRIPPEEFRELVRNSSGPTYYAVDEIVFNEQWKDFERACRMTESSRTSYLVAEQFGSVGLGGRLASWIEEETRRRALLTQLALIAYKLDHGEYPATLAELVPEYLSKTQLDPYSGENFQYRAEGLKHPLLYHADESADLSELSAETTLFWSVGIFDCRLEKLLNYADLSSYYEKEFGMSGGYGGSYGEVIIEEPQNIEPLPEGHTVYQFRGKNSGEYNPHNLVFPMTGKQAEQNP